MSELVRKMQEWRAVSLIPSELIDEVKELVREKAALEAGLEAMERALRYWLPDETMVLTEHEQAWNNAIELLAAAQQEGR